MDTEITSEDQHVPLLASAPPADEDDSPTLVEAVAVEVPQHYIEVQAPADLPENYELTVQVEGGITASVVLVVRAFIDEVWKCKRSCSCSRRTTNGVSLHSGWLLTERLVLGLHFLTQCSNSLKVVCAKDRSFGPSFSTLRSLSKLNRKLILSTIETDEINTTFPPVNGGIHYAVAAVWAASILLAASPFFAFQYYWHKF